MAPRGFTLPSAKTDSAKAARSAFFCELCQKGYSRMNEYEAHESSYDHQHKKRLKDMKEMQKQVQTSNRKEEKGPLMSIKLGSSAKPASGTSSGGGGGFKKGGFKNAFAPIEQEEQEDIKQDDTPVQDIASEAKPISASREEAKQEDTDSDVTDQEDYYDPRRPTDCMPGCQSKTLTVKA